MNSQDLLFLFKHLDQLQSPTSKGIEGAVFGVFVKNGMTPNISVPDRETLIFTLKPQLKMVNLNREGVSHNYCGSDSTHQASGFGNFFY